MRAVWGLILGLWLTSSVAGTPDHLMWIGQGQDALIMGEIKRVNADQTRDVYVIASLAPSKWWSLKAKQRFSLRVPNLSPLAKTLSFQKGQKYFMSLHKVGQAYEAAWGLFPLTRDSQHLLDAQLAEASPDFQFLLNTGARYAIPSFLFNAQAASESYPQIPAEQLQHLASAELLQIFLTYPHLNRLQAVPMQTAFTQLQTHFNGLAALLQQSDVAQQTFKVLRAETLGDLSDMHPHTLKALSLRQTALVLVMAQASVLQQLSQVDRLALSYLSQRRLKQLQAQPKLQDSAVLQAYRLLQQRLALAH